jgi:hypothetical protein
MGAAVAWVLLSALACTCNTVPVRGTTVGELGKGVFIYRCADLTDPVCPFDGEKPADFPELIAVGSRFVVEYEALDDGRYERLDSPTSHVRSDGFEFEAVEPGWAAIVAYEGDAVFDLVHIQIVEPDALVADLEADVLEVGAETTIAAWVETVDGAMIAGALPYEWEADPPGIVALGGQPNDRLTAVGLAAGLATVTVSDGTLEVSLSVEVLPGEVLPGSTAETAADTDTAADTPADTAVGSTP